MVKIIVKILKFLKKYPIIAFYQFPISIFIISYVSEKISTALTIYLSKGNLDFHRYIYNASSALEALVYTFLFLISVESLACFIPIVRKTKLSSRPLISFVIKKLNNFC